MKAVISTGGLVLSIERNQEGYNGLDTWRKWKNAEFWLGNLFENGSLKGRHGGVRITLRWILMKEFCYRLVRRLIQK